MSNAIGPEGNHINDEDEAATMWLLARGWINEDGQATNKHYNFNKMTPGELADFVSHLGGEESRFAAECYSSSHAYRRTGPGSLIKRERLFQKALGLVLQNPARASIFGSAS